jgi:hypothetical protein
MTLLRIASVLLILMIFPAQAVELAGGFGLYIGNSFLELDNLNSDLARFGYEDAPEQLLTLGFDTYLMTENRIIYGIEYGHYSGSSNGTGGGVAISGMRFALYFGYVAYEKRGWRIISEAGIGATNFDLTITDIPDEISFGQVMFAPSRSVQLEQNSYFSKINLAVDLDLAEINKKSNLTLGFRSGYLFATGSNRWEGAFVTVEKGPRVSLGGPYLNLVLYVSGVLRP